MRRRLYTMRERITFELSDLPHEDSFAGRGISPDVGSSVTVVELRNPYFLDTTETSLRARKWGITGTIVGEVPDTAGGAWYVAHEHIDGQPYPTIGAYTSDEIGPLDRESTEPYN
jgi:hypothetical protein